jgi:hypothetical protein
LWVYDIEKNYIGKTMQIIDEIILQDNGSKTLKNVENNIRVFFGKVRGFFFNLWKSRDQTNLLFAS